MRALRTSLRRRLTALCALLTVAALGVTGFDSYQRERAMLEAAMRSNLETLARMVAVNVQSGMEFGDPQEVTRFLATVVETMALQGAAVFTEDGTPFAASGSRAELPRLQTGSAALGGDWVGAVDLAYRDADGEQRTGRVVVRTSGAPMRASLSDYLAGFVLTATLALLGLVSAAHWLLSRLLRPVRELVATTRQVRSTEDYSLRAMAAGDDEIGALVRSFNGMLDVIQERDTRLARSAERLEQQVRERTAELRRALDAAEAATRAKSTFVANMSHEIRTPLNAVLGMSELAMETEDPRELREYLGVIRSAGSSLLGILCDILDLSKIESGKLELSTVAADLETLALEAMRPLTSRIQSKDLELVLDLAPELAAGYRVDDVRLRQILTNLVGNAIKFTARGFVLVRMTLLRDYGGVHEVEILVQDSGVGIPADRLQAIFSPFTQADSTITRRFAGTGLGLSITDRLVRLMGGRIRVESTLNVGTTFRVHLPMEIDESPLGALPTPQAGTRLVLLSRSKPTRDALTTIGRRLDAEVAVVDDVAGLAAAALREQDVLLVDDRDPDHDARLCALATPGPRGQRNLLLLTAYQDLASASARCREHHYAGYLTKPIAFRELAERIVEMQRPADAPANPSPATVRGTAPAAIARPLRILVAEDNAVNQKLIERILQRDGHSVTIAENGRACCEVFASEPFDVVLMDMQMPEMSGIEATAAIRRNEPAAAPRTPIVALTANTTVEDRDACLAAGMDDVLSKPVSVPKLRAVLAHFAAKKPAGSDAPGGGGTTP